MAQSLEDLDNSLDKRMLNVLAVAIQVDHPHARLHDRPNEIGEQPLEGHQPGILELRLALLVYVVTIQVREELEEPLVHDQVVLPPFAELLEQLLVLLPDQAGSNDRAEVVLDALPKPQRASRRSEIHAARTGSHPKQRLHVGSYLSVRLVQPFGVVMWGTLCTHVVAAPAE